MPRKPLKRSACSQPSPIGLRLRALREKAGISARELDRLAALKSGGHTSLIETVLGEGVRVGTLTPIARVLGVTLDYLATGKGGEPSADAVRTAVAKAVKAHRNAAA